MFVFDKSKVVPSPKKEMLLVDFTISDRDGEIVGKYVGFDGAKVGLKDGDFVGLQDGVLDGEKLGR